MRNTSQYNSRISTIIAGSKPAPLISPSEITIITDIEQVLTVKVLFHVSNTLSCLKQICRLNLFCSLSLQSIMTWHNFHSLGVLEFLTQK